MNISQLIAQIEEKIVLISNASEEDIRQLRKDVRTHMRLKWNSTDDLNYALRQITNIYELMWKKGYTLEQAKKEVL